jgi:hypothetical protein
VSNMVYFEVRNFQEFQHYSKRNPPWIRLYYRLLHDREFFRLKDETKFLVIGCYLLASQHENKIPADPEWIAKELSLTTVPDWQAVIDAQFILPIECDASTLLARLTKTCSHSITEVITDNSEVITEILSLPKKPEGSKREQQEVFDFWNAQSATTTHKIFKSQEAAIAKTLKRYGIDDIKCAIGRYSQVRANERGRYRDLYAWTLGEFLTRKDHYNIERFIAANWEEPFLEKGRRPTPHPDLRVGESNQSSMREDMRQSLIAIECEEDPARKAELLADYKRKYETESEVA